MVTTKSAPVVTKVRKNASAFNEGVLGLLDYKRWVPRTELVEKFGNTISKEQALRTFTKRLAGMHPDLPVKKQIQMGREHQIMLNTISLVQRGILAQQGRGEDKEFRLAK